jgi:hypothetical protein
MGTAERKLEELKQTNCNFSAYYAEFQYYAADVQCNNPAKRTTVRSDLHNEIKNTLTLSDNISQHFQEFIAFLQQLDN